MTTPRRILYFDHTAALGGGEIALLHLVQALDRARFEPVVVLASAGPLQALLTEAGVETHLLPLAAEIAQTRKDSLGLGRLLKLIVRTLRYVWHLARFISKCRVALVHTNSLKADLIGGLAARLARVPVIWHVRDRIENDYLPPAVVAIFRWLLRVIPNRVIANSHATFRTLHLAEGAVNRVVHDGVVTTPEQFTRLPAEAPLIGIVGRISPWKGQHIFLRAAVAVHASFPGARFQVIGSALFDEAAYEREVRELAATLGLGDSVEFTGFRPDVQAMTQRLDLLVHASTTGEPFGQVVAEGMMAGRPVIATRGGGVPEIIEDGLSGLLVPMGDAPALATAIIGLLENPDRAAALAQAGRRRILEHFTIEQTAQRVQQIYEEMGSDFSSERMFRGGSP